MNAKIVAFFTATLPDTENFVPLSEKGSSMNATSVTNGLENW